MFFNLCFCSKTVDKMRQELFKTMKETGGMYIPLKENRWGSKTNAAKIRQSPPNFRRN
jgi:hypothetical protein